MAIFVLYLYQTMQKISFLFSILMLGLFSALAQQGDDPVVIKKKVEVVDYNYEYLYLEFVSSAYFSTFFPTFRIKNASTAQLYFEDGRNARLGIDFGFLQSVKVEKLSVSTGIGYQLINENFSYGEYQTRQVEVQQPDGTYQMMNIAYGTPQMYSHLNQLGYLKIPLTFNYRGTLFKNDFLCSFGINYHRLVFASYMAKFTVSEPAEIFSFQKFNPSNYSFTGEIFLHKKLKENININVGPYVNYWMNDLIQQKQLTYGLRVSGIKLIVSFQY